MNETNLVDVAKLDTQTAEKAKKAVKLTGDADFASELSASSLMLQFFDSDAKQLASSGYIERSTTASRSSTDQSYERKVGERYDQYLRDVKERFEAGQRAAQLRQDVAFDYEDNESVRVGKAVESKDSSKAEGALQAKSDAKIGADAGADIKQDAKAEKIAELNKSTTENKESSIDGKESKEVKNVLGRVNAGQAGQSDAKDAKNAAATVIKGEEAESSKNPDSTSLKVSANAKPDGEGFAAPEENSTALPKETLNLANQIKAAVVNGISGAGASFSKVSPSLQGLENISTSTSGSPASAVQNGTQVGSTTKAVPLTRSNAFDSFLVRQVATKMALTFRNNVSTAKLTLNPPELGKLRVELIMEGTTVKATIATENVLVRDSLEANVALLRQSLASNGLNVSDVNIVLAGESDGYNKTSGNASGGRGSGNKGKEQNAPEEQVRATASLDNDGLDIFI